MSVEINNNFHPKLEKHVDERLKTVADVASLPDPNVASNFIYEGAIAYVGGSVKKHYKCVITSGVTKAWELFETEDLVIGEINITPATSVLDLSLVSPAISNCYAVKINIIGGTSATLQSITNFPADDKQITFYLTAGQEVTFKHFDYDVATTDQVVLENGFDMTLVGRVIGDESLTLKKHGTAVCQWDATQFMKKSEWFQNLLTISIVDNLTSTDTDKALSANQGKTLKDLVDTKQDILTAGEKIEITSGNVVNALARDWQDITPSTPVTVTSATAYIITLSTSTSADYRYVDLRNFGSNDNLGLWLLPAKKDPAVAANWVNIDLGVERQKTVRYSLKGESSLDTQTLQSNTMFHPKFILSSLLGDNLDLSTNIDGNIDEKVSFAFNKTGTYEIEVSLSLEVAAVNVAVVENFDVVLYQTDGAQLSTDPINTGTVVMRDSFGSYKGSTTKYPSQKLSFTVEVTTVGQDNGYTIVLYNATTGDFANVDTSNFGELKITKIK